MTHNDTFPRVLVVDDEHIIRYCISRSLRGKAEVMTASTAEEALEKISSAHYDLCLLDVFMPGMNGLDAMKKIREISPRTKVAVMTGLRLNETMKKQVDDEAYAFIEKPFSLSRLLEVLEKVSGDR